MVLIVLKYRLFNGIQLPGRKRLVCFNFYLSLCLCVCFCLCGAESWLLAPVWLIAATRNRMKYHIFEHYNRNRQSQVIRTIIPRAIANKRPLNESNQRLPRIGFVIR